MSKAFGTTNTSILAMGRSFRSLAVVVGAVALTRFVTNAAAAGDEIAKTADKLGVGVEELQELQFAAEQSGIEIGTFNTALQRFTRRAAEAARGTGEARGAFEELGIQLTDVNGNLRPTEQLLEDVADAFANTENSSDRLRLAFKLFDTEGVALVNLLGDGSDAMNELREEAQRLGIIMSEETARRAEELTDQINILTRQISVGLTEALVNATSNLVDFFRALNTPVENRSLEFLQRDIERSTERINRLSQQISRLGRDPATVALLQREIEERNRLLERAATLESERAAKAAESRKDILDALTPEQQKREDIIKALRLETTDSLRLLAVQKGTTQERERLVRQLEIEANIRKLGAEATAEEISQVIELTKALQRSRTFIEGINDLRAKDEALIRELTTVTDSLIAKQVQLELALARGTITQREYNAALAELAERQREASITSARLAGGFSEILARLIVLGQVPDRETFISAAALAADDLAENLGEAIVRGERLADVARQFTEQIAVAVAKFAILKTIETGIGLFSPKLGEQFNKILKLQGGGPLGANQPAIVGEKGPELFIPKVPGVVLPNRVVRSTGPAAAGLGTQVNVIVNNNAPGVSVEQRLAANGRDVELFIESVASRSIKQGRLNADIKQQFGVRNRL